MSAKSMKVSGGPIVIQGPADDAEGHAWRSFVSEPDETDILAALRGKTPGPVSVRLEPVEEADTEGHLRASTAAVRLTLGDDDTEGHIISLHFPTAEAADAFRRRLLATGLVAATLTVGALGATQLPNIEIGASGSQAAVTQQAGAVDRDVGLMDFGARAAAAEAAQSAAAAAERESRDVGIMDRGANAAAAGAAATGAGAQERTAESDIGIMDRGANAAAAAAADEEAAAPSEEVAPPERGGFTPR